MRLAIVMISRGSYRPDKAVSSGTRMSRESSQLLGEHD